MVRISDGRMSGTASGTIVLHVTPESYEKGPLAVVKNGDLIKLDVPNRKIDLLISEDELNNRISQISDNKVKKEAIINYIWKKSLRLMKVSTLNF